MDSRQNLPSAAGGIALAALLLFGNGPGHAALQLWSDTFEDNNTLGWTLTNNGAVIAVDATIGNGGTHSLKVTGNANAGQGATGTSRTIACDFTRDYTVQMAFRYTDFHWDRFLVFGHIRLLLDQPGLRMLFDPVGNNSFVGNGVGVNAFNSYLAAGTWGWITVHCRPSVRQYSVFIDGTLVGTVSYQATVAASNQLWFEDNHSISNFLNAWYDDFSVWGFQMPQNFADPFFGTDVEDVPAHWAQPPPVPFHGQYLAPNPLNEPFSPPRPNGRCAIACLHMIFDRYGDILPIFCPGAQEQIECAANTNDRVAWPNGQWKGTASSDTRRAGHFSNVSTALTNIRAGNPPAGQPGQPGIIGYSWRDLGYSTVDSIWTDLTTDTVDTSLALGRPFVLETFLGSGYPIIACINPPPDYNGWLKPVGNSEGFVDSTAALPETTAVGHAVVLIGYDNLGACPNNPWRLDPRPGMRPAFLLHDPAVAKYAWMPMAKFWQIWTKRFIFAAPWEIRLLSKNVWYYGSPLDASLLISYTGPAPLNGLYPVSNAQASLVLTNLGFQGGEVATHNIFPPGNTAVTGDWCSSTWKLQAPGWVPGNPAGASVAATAWGTLNPAVSSRSYQNYADQLGGAESSGKQLTLQIIPGPPHDPGHHGWPYPGHWWCDLSGGGGGGGGIGSGIHLRLLAGTTYAVSATLQNFGTDPVPAGTICRFSFTDPTLAERSGLGTLIGSVTVPPLAFGDTATVGPVTWTAPPGNSFGQPRFCVQSEIVCTLDPPESVWPQDENNLATLSEYRFATNPGTPVSMLFWVENPTSSAASVVLWPSREEGAESWGVGVTLPIGVPIPLAAGQSLPCEVIVTPDATASSGTVEVEEFLYTTVPNLVRETGGVTMRIGVDLGGDVDPAATELRLALEQNRPNPFAVGTTIRFSLPRPGDVDLGVYDVAGRLVRKLLHAGCGSGWHAQSWTGCDNSDRPVAAGVYFCRLSVDERQRLVRRMVIVR